MLLSELTKKLKLLEDKYGGKSTVYVHFVDEDDWHDVDSIRFEDDGEGLDPDGTIVLVV